MCPGEPSFRRAPALAAGCPQRTKLGIDSRGGARRAGGPQPFEHPEDPEALALAQTIGSRRELSDGITHDATLSRAEPRGKTANLCHAMVIESERDFDHPDLILNHFAAR